jgi:hypothetical protein
MKKYAYFAILSLMCCACSSTQMKMIAPTHIGVTPSVEWEMQYGQYTKTKPKISSSIDWNF